MSNDNTNISPPGGVNIDYVNESDYLDLFIKYNKLIDNNNYHIIKENTKEKIDKNKYNELLEKYNNILNEKNYFKDNNLIFSIVCDNGDIIKNKLLNHIASNEKVIQYINCGINETNRHNSYKVICAIITNKFKLIYTEVVYSCGVLQYAPHINEFIKEYKLNINYNKSILLEKIINLTFNNNLQFNGTNHFIKTIDETNQFIRTIDGIYELLKII